MKRRTSVRRAEVVSNLKREDGTDILTRKTIEAVLREKANVIKDYAYIIHDKDRYTDAEAHALNKEPDSLKPPHAHIDLRFDDRQPQHLEDIAGWFGLAPNFVEKIKGSWAAAIAYLIHQNAPEKFQYALEEVTANFDVAEVIAALEESGDLDIIIERILNGEIREYNKTEEIDPYILIYKARHVREAFRVRQEKLLALKQERNTDVIFITGQPGVGKTTLAKRIAEERGLDFFISSGSNDILDGYAQQPCLIVDDVRPASMGLSDFFKLLDNNTASSIKSRYHNKYVNCDLVILTSVLTIDDFFRNIFGNDTEPITQLKRRCQTYIRMDRYSISVYVWDKKRMAYSRPVVRKNDVISEFVPKTEITEDDVMDKVNTYLPFLSPIGEVELPTYDEAPAGHTDSETPQMISDSEFSKLMPQQEDDHDT